MIWASYVATDVIKLYLFQEILFFFFKETSTEHCTHANMLLLRCWSRMKLWNSGYSAAGPCQGSGGWGGGGAHLANRAWVILAGLDITCQQLDHYSLGEVAGGSSFSRRWCVVESLHDILAKARNKGEHHQHLLQQQHGHATCFSMPSKRLRSLWKSLKASFTRPSRSTLSLNSSSGFLSRTMDTTISNCTNSRKREKARLG